MFAGPGAGPLLLAAAAWDALAEELASAAASFGNVTSELVTSSWLGPSARAMLAVATQYAAWLSAAAMQATGAAGQAKAVAGAFEAALAAAVQPAVVAANRGLAQVLAATNWLGQNAPAIADIEAAYEQMWALDVAAMSGYHADASAIAQALAPWEQALQGLDASKLHLGIFGGHSSAGNGSSGSNSGSSGLGGGAHKGGGATMPPLASILGLGNGNIGLFNSGTGNIGFFNSGSGNVGIFNSGTGNMGFLNTGALNMGFGNTGSSNVGFFNAGVGETGLMGQNPQELLGADNVTGGLGTPAYSPGILNSVSAVTGGFNPGLANPAMLNSGLSEAVAAPAGANVASLASVNPSIPVSSAASIPGALAAPAVAASGVNGTSHAPTIRGTNGDLGVRNPAIREAENDAEGIPSSGFFDKLKGEAAAHGVSQPSSAD